MNEARIITESNSPYSALIVIVRKSNGDIRITCDYVRLNAICKISAYAMPLIQECLDTLGNQQSTIFSIFDAFS